ncbi:MAG: hypothetical protein U0931_36445 [Vulcanimicrobiota bacterium]
MKISKLPPSEQAQAYRAAEKLKRVVDGIAMAAIQHDTFQRGCARLADASLQNYEGRFTGAVDYDPESKKIRSVDLVCHMGSFATLTYKLDGSRNSHRYERVMKQAYNERSQVLLIDSQDLDYHSNLKNIGPFQPDYDEEFKPGPPPTGLKPAFAKS